MKLELAKLSKPFMAEEVHAEFCAKYLPQTIEGFINLPPLTDDDYEEDDELRDEVYDLDNSFSLMLTLVKASPYFVRYLQSSHPCASPGKKFVGIYAKRLYDNALTLDMRWKKAFPGTEEPVVEHARDTVMNSLGFLQTILLSVTDLKTGLGEIIDFDTREGLLIFVKKWLWDLKREGHARGDEAKHLIPLLVGDMTQLLKAEYYTRLMRNALNCAVPGCDKGEQLKACGRCKTVRYVSASLILSLHSDLFYKSAQLNIRSFTGQNQSNPASRRISRCVTPPNTEAPAAVETKCLQPRSHQRIPLYR
jgi:hypothetical protein